MVREVITIRLENKATDKEDAAFEAGRYLAYADQTNTIGQSARVDNIYVANETVYVHLTVPLLSGEDRTRFIDEIDRLSRVIELSFVEVA